METSILNKVIGGGNVGQRGRIDERGPRDADRGDNGGSSSSGSLGGVNITYAATLLGQNLITPAAYNALAAGGSPTAVESLLTPTQYAILTNQPVPVNSLPSVYGTYNATTQYQPGTILQYQPPGTQNMGTYQVTVAPPAGTPPTNAYAQVNLAYFSQLASPGPVVLYEADITCPALAGLAASASVTGVKATPGTALPTLNVPPGHRYQAYVSEPRPTTPGTSRATDHLVEVDLLETETFAPDGVTVQLVLTPTWYQYSGAVDTLVTAVALGFLTAHVRIVLQ